MGNLEVINIQSRLLDKVYIDCASKIMKFALQHLDLLRNFYILYKHSVQTTIACWKKFNIRVGTSSYHSKGFIRAFLKPSEIYISSWFRNHFIRFWLHNKIVSFFVLKDLLFLYEKKLHFLMTFYMLRFFQLGALSRFLFLFFWTLNKLQTR